MHFIRLSTIVTVILTAVGAAAFYFFSYVVLPEKFPVFGGGIPAPVVTGEPATTTPPIVLPPPILHVVTPDAVRAIYMTACVASLPVWRTQLATLITDTELNAVIIDVKDYTGTISIPVASSSLPGMSGKGCKVHDMPAFLKELHERGIYVIGRIAVFQDPLYTKQFPEYAVKKSSDKKAVWKDRKGLSFVDVGAKPYWDYIVEISKEAYAQGFDELNFDYIRFPSDGDMKDIYYSWSDEQLKANRDTGKADVVRGFFEYLHASLASTSVKTSADLFGMTSTNADDLGIGQILEYAAPYFDFVAPMVYPSHYPKGFNGYQDVNAHPYDIVKFSMDRAVARLIAASTTPEKLRPWLQDNNYPVPYTADMVRAQIQATYDAGLDSWMLWDPANRYTRGALLGPEEENKNSTTTTGN